MTETREPGRRERKKAQTRHALTEAAQRLFLEHGYDNVTVAQIADAADTAVTTLFKHFPDGKDAVIFGDAAGDDERAQSLIHSVVDRPEGTSIVEALHRFFRGRGPFEDDAPELARLIAETPQLRAYARRQWERAEEPLAQAIAKERGTRVDASIRALARFALQAPDLASGESRAGRNKALDAVFARLADGWGY